MSRSYKGLRPKANCVYSVDEVKEPDTGGIGKNLGNNSYKWHDANDRIVFEWQVYAGRFNAKTVDSYLATVRDFERKNRGQAFQFN